MMCIFCYLIQDEFYHIFYAIHVSDHLSAQTICVSIKNCKINISS